MPAPQPVRIPTQDKKKEEYVKMVLGVTQYAISIGSEWISSVPCGEASYTRQYQAKGKFEFFLSTS